MADEEEQLKESLKNHPHLTLEELREFKELFNLVSRCHVSQNTQKLYGPPRHLGNLGDELKALFMQVDEDKGGSISPQELGSLMETLGLKPNQVSVLPRSFLSSVQPLSCAQRTLARTMFLVPGCARCTRSTFSLTHGDRKSWMQ